MHFHEVNIPEELISAAYSGSLVVFAGAGVSRQEPMCFPLFDDLVSEIRNRVDPTHRKRDRRHKEIPDEGSKLPDEETENPNVSIVYTEAPEQYLSYLEKEAGKVRQTCCSVLNQEGMTSTLHKNLLRLFPLDRSIKIITTNFDECFEVAIKESELECDIYSSPALPYGDSFSGLAHLHGSIINPEAMVLLAEDYGRAYVTNGWASRFLVDLFEKHTVLFIGYSCGDSLVDYLTRSIAGHINGRAYTLCKSGEDDSDWLVRGVTPICFKEYDDLPFIIGDWATYLEQSITDRVCKLKEIAGHAELNDTEKEYIIHSFNWYNNDDCALFAHEFCSASSNFEHLVFLKENNQFSFLTDEKLDDRDDELLRWSINNFSINNCLEFQQLCAPIRSRLSCRFFDYLTRHLLFTNAPSIAMGPWIAWLESMPLRYYSYCSYVLAELAAKCMEPEIFFALVRMILRVDLFMSKDVFTGLRQEPIVAINDRFHEDKILTGLKRHRLEIGDKVFDYCFQQIELAYSIQTSCWTVPNAFDGISYSRSSVEPHDQDSHSYGAASILLDVLRESVDPESSQYAIDKCLNSKCAILVRLGIWLTAQYNCSGAGLKLIQDRGLLLDCLLHHETFHLMRKSFNLASDKQRTCFVQYLRSYFASNEDSDYECFTICGWILETEQYEQLSKLKSEILERNPDFLPREHPDFTHYMTFGSVDNTEECRINKSLFTIEEMIHRLNMPTKPGSFVSEFDIVSVPCGDFPDLAFAIIRQLLAKRRTDEENRLCNLLIKAMEWSSPAITTQDASDLFTEIFKERDFCVEGIKALASFTFSANDRVEWTASQLALMLNAASKSVEEYLRAEPAIEPGDNPDWFLIGINHPAGKYLQLIAELERIYFKETGSHCDFARKLVFELDLLDMNEFVGSKALIACFFENLNLWTALDVGLAKESIKILGVDDWSLVPAWQGMSRLNGLSTATWELTKEQWELLFSDGIPVGKEIFDALVRLYVWITIVHAPDSDKPRMLKSCGSWSYSAFEAACFQIDNWLETLDDEQRLHAWNNWISESFDFVASSTDSSGKILASMYCRWLGKYSDLRPVVVKALVRDCKGIYEKDLFVHEGVLSDIAQDSNLEPSEISSVIAFILNHQKYLAYEDDARDAAKHIDLEKLSDCQKNEIKDAYTRRGMSDIIFG